MATCCSQSPIWLRATLNSVCVFVSFQNTRMKNVFIHPGLAIENIESRTYGAKRREQGFNDELSCAQTELGSLHCYLTLTEVPLLL